jgi:1A family penicillin-binding protein
MKFVYYILLTIANVFIFVGETTQYVLFAPIRIAGSLLWKSAQYIRHKISLIRLPQLPKRIPKKKVLKPKKKPINFTKLNIKRKKKRGRPRIIPFFIRVEYFIIGFATCVLAVVIFQSYQLVRTLPSPKSIGKVNYALSTHIYDRNGHELYEIYDDQNRTPAKLSTLPVYVYEASIAIEDKEFFNHKGVAWYSGVGRAVREFILHRSVQGGSTITQQLVKSSLLGPERTIERKLKEIILALWTERLYSKKQILEMYLNQVPYGGSTYGIEEASRTYFNKAAKDLTIEEAALLAGLPQAPSVYSPFADPILARARRNDVLRKMYEQKYITPAQYIEARKKPLSLVNNVTHIKAPHFVFYTREELAKQFDSRTVEKGGLKVYTTLDITIQNQAERILKEELTKIKNLNVTNGAILVTKPSTGEILAMVGSEDYFEDPSGAFNVTTALRQPGSSIKPLMYSLAMEKGLTAASTIDDSPITYAYPGGPSYHPVNYDGRYHGRVTFRTALSNSYNIPAVKTLNSVGVSAFVDHARSMGITTWNEPQTYGLSLALGGGEVHMTDMATAYGVFATLGNKIPVHPLNTVTDLSDEALYQPDGEPTRVLSQGISYIMSDILSDNQARQSAFGPHSALEIPGYKVAVKTGTTDSKKDNWTIGYTPEYLVAVWVGNNDNTPMNPALTSGITGAAPIWNRVMTYLLTSYSNKNSWFNKPDDVVEKVCYGNKKEYFVKGTEDKLCNRVMSPTPPKK